MAVVPIIIPLVPSLGRLTVIFAALARVLAAISGLSIVSSAGRLVIGSRFLITRL